MTTLKFTTVDQHLVLQRQPVVASGDKNSVLIQIQLCSMWDGFDVKVAFYKDGNRDFVLDIPLENGECMIPPEMLDTPCVLNIGVWGKDARGRHKTSTMVKYRVHEGTPIEEGVTLVDVRDGTADEDQVLDGATFYAGDTGKKTGSIPTYEDGDPVYMIPCSETDPTVPAWAKQPAKPKYTAEEVGARPNTWTPTESDPTVPAWAKQPQKPTYTAAEIGAAPAGFGLGQLTTELKQLADCNDALRSGWYRTSYNYTVNQPINRSNWMRVDSYNATNVHQTWFYDLYSGCTLDRWLVNGVWGEWEWVNPPMRLGEEYRTTERFMWKPVYTKLVDFGALPSSETKSVSTGVDGKYIKFEGVIKYKAADGNVTVGELPFVDNTKIRARIGMRNNLIQITTTEDLTNWTGTVLLKYTKD